MARWHRATSGQHTGLHDRLLADRERLYTSVAERIGVDAPPAPTWPDDEPIECYVWQLDERPADLHPNTRVTVWPDDRIELVDTDATSAPSAQVVDLGARRRR